MARLASPFDVDANSRWVSPIYAAAALLVVAQILGIYALKTRKADLIFALAMAGLLVLAIVLGAYGVYHKLH